MPSVGSVLKQARERLGLSTAQIEERTKVQTYKIEALENGDFARLPDGIYLDGIIRAYAHEVGLAPEPLIQQARYERVTIADDWDAPFGDLDALFRKEEATDSRTPPKIDGAGESLRSERPPAPAAPEEDIAREHDAVVASPHSGLFASRGVEIDLAARRAGLTPFQPPPRRSPLIPLLVLAALAGWGAYLYEVYRRPAMNETAALSVRSPAPSDASTNNPATASGNLPSPVDDQRRGLDANAGAVGRESAGTAGTAVPPQSPPDAAPQSPNVEPRGEPPAAGTPTATRSASTVAPAADVSGNWRLNTRVESSNTSEFIGLSLGFDIQLHQAGNRITGSGRKVIENGTAIAAQGQTPISLEGTISGDRLTLTFTERGARRATQGKFVLLLETAGTLRGRFTSTAAQSSGTVEARRGGEP